MSRSRGRCVNRGGGSLVKGARIIAGGSFRPPSPPGRAAPRYNSPSRCPPRVHSAAGETGMRCRASNRRAKAAAAPATVRPVRRAPHATAARRGGKASGQHRPSPETGLQPACAGMTRRRRGRRPQRGRRCRRRWRDCSLRTHPALAASSPPSHVRCPPRCFLCFTAVRGCTAHRGASPCPCLTDLRARTRQIVVRRSRWPHRSAAAAQIAQPAQHDARTGRRHRRARRAADRRRAGRRHRDRRRRDPAQRRAEPGRTAAASARRRDRAERRTGLGVRRAAARCQPRPDAGADRRPARRGRRRRASTTLEAIPLDQIDRIEILRGPASSLYGADAIGGVIQVFTKRPQGSRAFAPNVSAGYGTYDTGAVSAGFAGATGSLRYALQAGGRTSDGFNAIVNPDNYSYNPDRDGLSTANLSANLAGPGRRDRNWRCSISATGSTASSTVAPPISTIARSRRCRRGARPAATGSTMRGPRCSRPGRAATTRNRRRASATSTFTTTQRQYLWQNDFTLPRGYAGRDSRAARGAPGHRRRFRDDAAQHQFRDRRLPAALRCTSRCRPTCAATIRTSTAGKTTGGIALGYKLVAGMARDRRLQHRLQGAVVQRSLLSGLSPIRRLVPETSRNVEVGAYWTRAAGDVRWEARGDRLPQPGERTHRVRSATLTSTAAAERRPRHARGCHAGPRPHLARHAGDGVARPAEPDGRRHRQAAAAPRAHARCGAAAAAGGPGAAGAGVRRIVAALRRRGRHGEDGRLRHRQSHRRVAVREGVLAALARQQRARTGTTSWPPTTRRAGRPSSRACAGSRDARARGRSLGAALATFVARAAPAPPSPRRTMPATS